MFLFQEEQNVGKQNTLLTVYRVVDMKNDTS